MTDESIKKIIESVLQTQKKTPLDTIKDWVGPIAILIGLLVSLITASNELVNLKSDFEAYKVATEKVTSKQIDKMSTDLTAVRASLDFRDKDTASKITSLSIQQVELNVKVQELIKNVENIRSRCCRK